MEAVQKRIDTAGIADLLGYSRRHVTEVVTKRPDFPKPILNLSQKNRWWSEVAVLEWAQKVTQAA